MSQDLKQYLDMISTANPKLGHAICPFLKQYKDKTQTIRVKNLQHLKTHLHTVCGILGAIHMEAVVLHGFRCGYDRLHKICDDFNRKYSKLDITILAMHPDTEDSPLGIEYNYKTPLLIVQRTSTLEKARTQLKGSKYYDNWQED
jgi:hypothetical protein